MEHDMVVTFSRSPQSVALTTAVLCCVPAPLLLVGLGYLARKGAMDRVLFLWQRLAVCLAMLLLVLLVSRFVLHQCQFTHVR